jgi:GMP synthase-like glutamine amidotransferase
VTQAFRVDGHARGVQFHPEVRQAQAMAWFSAESRELPLPLAEIERELTEKLPVWQEHGRALCRAFLRDALDV